MGLFGLDGDIKIFQKSFRLLEMVRTINSFAKARLSASHSSDFQKRYNIDLISQVGCHSLPRQLLARIPCLPASGKTSLRCTLVYSSFEMAPMPHFKPVVDLAS
jgi:hypothetical protein